MASSPELSRIFSTAIVSTRVEKDADFSREITQLMQSPAFLAILSTVERYAQENSISTKQAAEEIIETFRKMDAKWSSFIFQQGVNRIKS